MVKLKTLKNAYEEAVETEAEKFSVDGKELVTGYAKYLIEYAEMRGAKAETNLDLVPQ